MAGVCLTRIRAHGQVRDDARGEQRSKSRVGGDQQCARVEVAERADGRVE
jgi:hypothetical protein